MGFLFEDMMEPFIIVNEMKVSDGESGYKVVWLDGAEILAALTHDSTLAARIAEADGLTSTYTVTTHTRNMLYPNNVIKRKSDGATFRITSNSEDIRSPKKASFSMAQCSAERWALT